MVLTAESHKWYYTFISWSQGHNGMDVECNCVNFDSFNSPIITQGSQFLRMTSWPTYVLWEGDWFGLTVYSITTTAIVASIPTTIVIPTITTVLQKCLHLQSSKDSAPGLNLPRQTMNLWRFNKFVVYLLQIYNDSHFVHVQDQYMYILHAEFSY